MGATFSEVPVIGCRFQENVLYCRYMGTDFGADIFSVTDTKLSEPKQYQVIFLNDDYTTMEFVTEILQVIFHKSEEDALQLMRKVHSEGAAVVGTYTYDIAVTRSNLTMKVARQQGFPLRCEMREA